MNHKLFNFKKLIAPAIVTVVTSVLCIGYILFLIWIKAASQIPLYLLIPAVAVYAAILYAVIAFLVQRIREIIQ